MNTSTKISHRRSILATTCAVYIKLGGPRRSAHLTSSESLEEPFN